MSPLPVVIPVLYRDGPGGPRVGFTEVSVAQVTSADAPVAVRYTEGRQVNEYRCHGGALWRVLHDNPARAAVDRFKAGRTVEEWVARLRAGEKDASGPGCTAEELAARLRAHETETFNDLAYLPLQGRRPWRDNWSWTRNRRIDTGSPDAPDYLEAVRHVRGGADDLLVVDGVLHQRCLGPVLRLSSRPRYIGAGGVELAPHHGGSEAKNIDHRAFRFSALDREAVVETVERHFGVRPPVFGDPPEVLVADGYDTDVLPSVAESTAWHMVWALRDLPPRDTAPEAIAAVIGLRKALQDRWPGAALNFDPKLHEHTWDHLPGRTLPDGVDLYPAMSVVVRDCAHLVGQGVANAWRMNLGRIGLRYGLADDVVPQDDRDALAGVSI
jgi:hypothetical protein